MSFGVWRMWESAWFRNEVWPPFKKKYPTDARKVEQAAAGNPAVRPKANFALGIWEEMRAHPKAKPPPPPPPPPPPDPTPVPRYAPRTHNLGGRDQDPRFCCKPEYGVKLINGEYVDEMGCRYDTDHMFNISNDRQRDYMVDGLNGADDMNGLEPCDTYINNGRLRPPYPGDPTAQTGSWHR